MSFSRPNMSIPIASATPSRSTQGSVYSSEDIETYQFDQQNQLKTYAALDAAQKSSVKTSEAVSIRGMVNVPVATDFNESKKSINELTTERGDMSQVPDIDICGFLGKVPSLDLDIPNASIGGLPSLNDIMAGINGITLPTLQIASEAIVGVVGKINDTIADIGTAIQSNIPTISCGKPEVIPTPQSQPQLGSALSQPAEEPVDAFIAEPVPYGTNPNIVIESPDVTVKSLDDEIDLGEF
jgi:hypothetical protein